MSVDKITIAAQAADKLEDILDDSDIPIAEALEGNSATRAFKDSASATEYVETADGFYANDRSITLTEMRRAFYQTYRHSGVSVEQSQKAADAVFQEVKRQLGATIDSGEEQRFLEILTTREAHLNAGGAVIIDETSAKSQVTVMLRAPGLSWDRIKGNIVPYNIYRHIGDVQVSYEIPISGSSNSYYLVTVTKAFGSWPTVTRLTFSGSGPEYRAEWTRVDDKTAATVLMAHPDRLRVAMTAAGLDTSGSAVTHYMDNVIIAELDSVPKVSGYHTYNTQTGDYRYVSLAQTTAIADPPDGNVFSAALRTAMVTVGRKGNGKIPVHIEGEGRKSPDKDETLTPAK
ncbi:MAG: hypothetical protein A3F89_04255 [Deltaproteobacteria bacterium RIFCSPLOWO2_12_FULL_50_11]|nr:MAG: hypothetical protein A3B79_00055 [Deltaproteobacteria bacterium RIFCSPHIGHO2_02_FULL_50_15]OGQ65556.1 MAG: hypothetical protein A3F89_04255 [Deltaproteobacteria bacterium RIFCSPLOWO2_12_FULL_50_11]